MAGLLMDDELLPFFGNPNIQRQGARARALAAQRDVNTLPDPRTYAAISGLLGQAPDELGFSVLNPAYEDIQRVGRPAFAVGTALGVAPMMRGMNLAPRPAARAPSAKSQLGIVSPDIASSLRTVRNLPPDELFQQAVAGTPGARITDQGLAMRVQRGQMPNQSLMPSVRGGVFYLPEGAAQAKHYGTGKTGYGGPEKIAGETVIANPLFVKGATGGKAPEAAYDSLFGKGAYEAMRSEAIKSYGGYGARPSDKLVAVDNFLSKYAPELQDQAEYIVKNSQQGNQLAYALQEAAVGSAVRSAGHDAVLGYSKGKKGPFISEVFDVREMNYPDKFGTPTSLWEEFFNKP